jgi:hypothetical protein
MKIDIRNFLTDKAKLKKDGVYKYKDYTYAVKGGSMVAYSDYFGNLYSCHGYFDTCIGTCNRHEIVKTLRKYTN